MRDLVIAECYRIADLLDEYLEQNLSQMSNRDLLELYGRLRVDLELEFYDDEELE